jgi:hypothetical protein
VTTSFENVVTAPNRLLERDSGVEVTTVTTFPYRSVFDLFPPVISNLFIPVLEVVTATLPALHPAGSGGERR